MVAWEELLRTALLGTERQPWSPPADGEPLGSLLQRLDASDADGRVLSAAGVLAAYRRAGRMPPASPAPTPEGVAPLVDIPRCSPRAAYCLVQILEGSYWSVLPEWLQAAAGAGCRVPEEKLPALLEAARAHPHLGDRVQPVLGARGRWLAAQNPDWRSAQDGTEGWQTESFETRMALLERIRERDPAAARDLVDATWQEDEATHRAAFVDRFEAGLSMEDEPFLEGALDDRRKEVRQAASRLLSRLEGSRLVARMRARLAPLLSFRKTWVKTVLDVRLPEACDDGMQRDGVEPRVPASMETMGERSWWLMQMVAAVPPAHWSSSWSLAPDAIVAWALATEFKAALLQGFKQATVRFRDGRWAWALLEVGGAAFDPKLLEALSAERREAFVSKRLAAEKNPLRDVSPVVPALEACTHPWSLPFARIVVVALQAAAADPDERFAYSRIVRLLPGLARRCPPEMASEVAAGWPLEGEAFNLWRRELGEFLSLLQFRHDMLQALKGES